MFLQFNKIAKNVIHNGEIFVQVHFTQRRFDRVQRSQLANHVLPYVCIIESVDSISRDGTDTPYI